MRWEGKRADRAELVVRWLSSPVRTLPTTLYVGLLSGNLGTQKASAPIWLKPQRSGFGSWFMVQACRAQGSASAYITLVAAMPSSHSPTGIMSTSAQNTKPAVEPTFWATYETIARDFDDKWLSRVNHDMGIILTFVCSSPCLSRPYRSDMTARLVSSQLSTLPSSSDCSLTQ